MGLSSPFYLLTNLPAVVQTKEEQIFMDPGLLDGRDEDQGGGYKSTRSWVKFHGSSKLEKLLSKWPHVRTWRLVLSGQGVLCPQKTSTFFF
jgi:hypothetical protein